MKSEDEVEDAARRSVAIAADDCAEAVTEAVRLRREVVRLVHTMRAAETLADAARIETGLRIVQQQYEAALMT